MARGIVSSIREQSVASIRCCRRRRRRVAVLLGIAISDCMREYRSPRSRFREGPPVRAASTRPCTAECLSADVKPGLSLGTSIKHAATRSYVRFKYPCLSVRSRCRFTIDRIVLNRRTGGVPLTREISISPVIQKPNRIASSPSSIAPPPLASV